MRANSSFTLFKFEYKRRGRVYDIRFLESGEKKQYLADSRWHIGKSIPAKPDFQHPAFYLSSTNMQPLPACFQLPYNPNMINIAAIQMVSSDTVTDNLELAHRLIAEAVSKQAKFVTLPENFPLMGKEDSDRLAIVESFGTGPIQSFLSEQSKKHHIWLLGGTIPLQSDKPDKVFATSLLYNPQGECIAHYNKIHLFDVLVDEDKGESYKESDTFEPGSEIVVVQTDIGNIGLSVCYDLRFAELYRKMHKDDVQIITAPSAFTATTGEAHWETLLRTRAVENLCYVIASNQGGIHVNQRETWGHSMIIDPWGTILAELKKGPGVAVAAIDLEKQSKLRKMFPTLTHRKLDYRLND